MSNLNLRSKNLKFGNQEGKNIGKKLTPIKSSMFFTRFLRSQVAIYTVFHENPNLESKNAKF